MITKARKKRVDILQNMPVGGSTLIAEKVKCSKGHVSAVLNGYKPDNNELAKNIIKEAELLAAVNVWKNRFCKFKSLL